MATQVYVAVLNSFLGDLGKYLVFFKSFFVITGGLDLKLVLWDFSNGRSQKIWDFGTLDTGNKGNTGQRLNPAFVHALVVSEVDVVDKFVKICAVAKGDGVVSVLNDESELNTVKSKSSAKPKKGSKSAPKVGGSSADPEIGNQNGGDLHLDHSLGGHTAVILCDFFNIWRQWEVLNFRWK